MGGHWARDIPGDVPLCRPDSRGLAQAPHLCLYLVLTHPCAMATLRTVHRHVCVLAQPTVSSAAKSKGGVF